MGTSRARPVATAGICLVAFGLGAATLTDPADATATPDAGLNVELSLPFSATWLYVALLVIGLGLAVVVYKLDDGGFADSRLDKAVSLPFLAGILVLGTVLTALLLSGGDGTVVEESFGGAENATEDINETVEEVEAAEPEGDGGPSNIATVALLGAILLGLLAVVWYEFAGDDDEPTQPEETTTDPADEREAIGDAAGEAADRIESSADAFENEVYTAWKEMTEVVDLRNPETTTPAEFAAAATDAGLERQHVETLTDVFEEVRYGGRDVTEEREEQAVEALRQIESAYGGEKE